MKNDQILLGTKSCSGEAVIYSGRVASAVFGWFLNLAKNALYKGRKNSAEPKWLDASLNNRGSSVEPLRRGETSFPGE